VPKSPGGKRALLIIVAVGFPLVLGFMIFVAITGGLR